MFLKKNERGRVVDLMGDCSCLHRLKEMGLEVGSVVTMLVPGRPCVLGVDGRRMSLRVDCEADILVEPLAKNTDEISIRTARNQSW